MICSVQALQYSIVLIVKQPKQVIGDELGVTCSATAFTDACVIHLFERSCSLMLS